MRSTSEVLTHHLKCFATRDLDGLMASGRSASVEGVDDKSLRTLRRSRHAFGEAYCPETGF